MITPTDLFHPPPAHLKTFQVFLIYCPKRPSFSTIYAMLCIQLDINLILGLPYAKHVTNSRQCKAMDVVINLCFSLELFVLSARLSRRLGALPTMSLTKLSLEVENSSFFPPPCVPHQKHQLLLCSTHFCSAALNFALQHSLFMQQKDRPNLWTLQILTVK